MDVRSFNVTPVSHFVKAEPLDKIFFFSKKVSNVFQPKKIKKIIFKYDEQKGLRRICLEFVVLDMSLIGFNN